MSPVEIEKAAPGASPELPGTPQILSLSEITNQLVGGKASGLAELHRLGFEVPAKSSPCWTPDSTVASRMERCTTTFRVV